MCGIVAVVGSRDAAPLLLQGLKQLEYRGYDSAGLATIQSSVSDAQGALTCLRANGKLANLNSLVDLDGAPGQLGIGHTRWATHGKPEERNAHPHRYSSGGLAVVQNGIIENHSSLRKQLESEGVAFLSDTDTEVIPHLIARELAPYLANGGCASGSILVEAVRKVSLELKGAYALAVIWDQTPEALVVARRQAPLLIGKKKIKNEKNKNKEKKKDK